MAILIGILVFALCFVSFKFLQSIGRTEILRARRGYSSHSLPSENMTLDRPEPRARDIPVGNPPAAIPAQQAAEAVRIAAVQAAVNVRNWRRWIPSFPRFRIGWTSVVIGLLVLIVISEALSYFSPAVNLMVNGPPIEYPTSTEVTPQGTRSQTPAPSGVRKPFSSSDTTLGPGSKPGSDQALKAPTTPSPSELRPQATIPQADSATDTGWGIDALVGWYNRQSERYGKEYKLPTWAEPQNQIQPAAPNLPSSQPGPTGPTWLPGVFPRNPGPTTSQGAQPLHTWCREVPPEGMPMPSYGIYSRLSIQVEQGSCILLEKESKLIKSCGGVQQKIDTTSVNARITSLRLPEQGKPTRVIITEWDGKVEVNPNAPVRCE